jgi:hypothetical protein
MSHESVSEFRVGPGAGGAAHCILRHRGLRVIAGKCTRTKGAIIGAINVVRFLANGRYCNSHRFEATMIITHKKIF